MPPAGRGTARWPPRAGRHDVREQRQEVRQVHGRRRPRHQLPVQEENPGAGASSIPKFLQFGSPCTSVHGYRRRASQSGRESAWSPRTSRTRSSAATCSNCCQPSRSTAISGCGLPASRCAVAGENERVQPRQLAQAELRIEQRRILPVPRVERRQAVQEDRQLALAEGRPAGIRPALAGVHPIGDVAHQQRPAAAIDGDGDDRLADLGRQPIEQPMLPDQHLATDGVAADAHDEVPGGRGLLDDVRPRLTVVRHRLDREERVAGDPAVRRRERMAAHARNRPPFERLSASGDSISSRLPYSARGGAIISSRIRHLHSTVRPGGSRRVPCRPPR